MEYFPFTAKILKCRKIEDVRLCIYQTLKALAFIHGKMIVHLDVKPSNILFKRISTHQNSNSNEMTLYCALCDFGISKFADDSLLYGSNGTLPFMAPEMLEYKSFDNTVDIWSAGMTFYSLLTGDIIKL
jgi:serine/threonine protein kinase